MQRSIVAVAGIAATLVALVVGSLSVRQERESRRLIVAGEHALAQGRTFDAIEAFSGAVALAPDSMLAYLRRGDTHRRRNEPDEALRDLGRASALNPTAPEPLELMGDIEAATGRHDAALRHYGAYVALDDRAAPALYKLALASYRTGDVPRAIDALTRALGITPDLAEAHYLLGLCAIAEGRDAEALSRLQRAVHINPGFVSARVALADLDIAAQRPQASLVHLSELAALEPATPDRLVGVALAFARRGRTDVAVATLSRAAARFPNDADVYTALGRVWVDLAEATDDQAALRKALQALQPLAADGSASSEVLSLYGRALLLSDLLVPAEAALRRAVRVLPVEPRTFRDLGATAARLGHTALANRARAQHAALTGATR